MDPITALSVAAATVQFVDFSLKILKLCKELRQTGTTKEYAWIESSVHELTAIQARLQPFTATDGVSREDVDAIETARRQCDKSASDLLQILQDLKPKKTRWGGNTVKAAWRGYRAQAKIASLQKKMEGRNEKLKQELTQATRKRVLHLLEDQKKSTALIKQDVQQMRSESAASHSVTQTAISSARTDLGAKLTSAALEQEASVQRIERKLEDARITAAQKDFLESLAFPEMSKRHENIASPAAGTYEWIFKDGDPSADVDPTKRELQGKFKRWLTSDEKVFWISGKPGSGKSSLMSFIENHDCLGTDLKQWTKTRSLTILNFFFWRPGSDLQKSIQGLLRSLLFQLLKRKPAVIDDIRACGSATRHLEWIQKRLLDVLTEVIVLYRQADECIFFLVDGLDEFEGEYLELLDVILRIELMSNAKICLSSRPEPAMQLRLQPYPSVRLEDLNYDDIKKFVCSKLASFTQLEAEFSKEIAQRAQGMFLWAALVTVNLVQGSVARDDKSMLQERLDSFPEGLQPLFARLFSDVDKHHREFLLFVFQLLKTNKGRGVTIALITASLQFKNIATLRGFCDQSHEVQRHVTLRSKGLLEVAAVSFDDPAARGWDLQNPSTKKPYHTALEDGVVRSWMKLEQPAVSWLHRSAYDYVFSSPEADLPAWVREIDITKAMLCGCAWLYTHDLLIWTCVPTPSRSTDSRIELVLNQILNRSAYSLGNALKTQLSKNPSFVYKVLDDVNEVLGSSLSDGSWLVSELKASLANINKSFMSENTDLYTRLWEELVHNDLQDYIVSRFESLKRESFAHATCGSMIHLGLGRLGDPLTGLILDFLIEKARRKTTTPAPNGKCSRFLHVPGKITGGISWLTYGELGEAMTMRDVIGAIEKCGEVATSNLQQDTKPDPPGDSSETYLAKFMTLSALWQLSANRTTNENLPLRVQIPVTHSVGSYATITSNQCDTPISFLCIDTARKARHYKSVLEGYMPICIFHPNPAINVELVRRLSQKGGKAEWPYGYVFRGSAEAFSTCRSALVEDVWSNTAGQLDAWQQLYLLACIKIYFVEWWDFEEPAGAQGSVDTDGNESD